MLLFCLLSMVVRYGSCRTVLAFTGTGRHFALTSDLTSDKIRARCSRNFQPNLRYKMSGAFKRLLPLFDRILIKKADAVSKTKGGIVIPEKAQAKVLKGTVVAVGPGARNQQGDVIPLTIKVGDDVLLPEYGGTKVELEENQECYLFRESDILAKVEN